MAENCINGTLKIKTTNGNKPFHPVTVMEAVRGLPERITTIENRIGELEDTNYDLTPNRVLVSDTSGHVNNCEIAASKLAYLDDVTSPIQSQIDGKLNSSDNAVSASKLNSSKTIDGVSFDGTNNITHFGTCTTSANVTEKIVTCTGFTLAIGAFIIVKFRVTNSAINPTLNVNGTGAKLIKYRGNNVSAEVIALNRNYMFVYDGENYQLIGDLDTTKIDATLSIQNSAADAKAVGDSLAAINDRFTNGSVNKSLMLQSTDSETTGIECHHDDSVTWLTSTDETKPAKIELASTANNVPWSGVTNTPTTLSGYGITNAVNSNDVVTSATANKVLKLNGNGALPANITGGAPAIIDTTGNHYKFQVITNGGLPSDAAQHPDIIYYVPIPQ